MPNETGPVLTTRVETRCLVEKPIFLFNGRRSRADDLSTNSFRVKRRFHSNHPLHVRNLIFKQVGRLYNALNDYPGIGVKKITAFMRLLQKRC